MITHLVRPGKIDAYESWLRVVHTNIKKFDGFRSADVIRPAEGEEPEYVILLKFDNVDVSRKWAQSKKLAEWLEKLPALIQSKTEPQEEMGMEMWFQRPQQHRLIKPPFWKQVIVGIIAVYPLLLVLQWMVNPLFAFLPAPAGLFVSVLIMVSLMTFPVMPIVTRTLTPWLYRRSGVKLLGLSREK